MLVNTWIKFGIILFRLHFWRKSIFRFAIAKPELQKSGIYKITCQQCNKEFFGMTYKCLEVRYNEHERDWRLRHLNESSLAKHMLKNKGHTTDITKVKLVKEVNKAHKLRFVEAIHIYKNKLNLMNSDLGNVKSPLLDLFTEKQKERTILDIITDHSLQLICACLKYY